MYGFEDHVIAEIAEAIQSRKEMNMQPVMLAAHALDPRFHGSHLSDVDWQSATNVILNLSECEQLNRQEIINDWTEYRSKSGPIFGDEVTWEAVNAESCTRNPQSWWMSFAPARQLTVVAVILLSMPATAAMVERCNKAYASQKTESRNRLLSLRAAKLASVSYNLKVHRYLSDPTVRQKTRKRRIHILALSTTSAAVDTTLPTATFANPEPVGVGSSNEVADQAQPDGDTAINEVAEDDGVVSMESILNVNESDLSDHSNDISDSDSNTVDDDCSYKEGESDSEEDDDDKTFAGVLGATPVIGDWVAVKVSQEQSKKGKGIVSVYH